MAGGLISPPPPLLSPTFIYLKKPFFPRIVFVYDYYSRHPESLSQILRNPTGKRGIL
jgi:hypothetical protein